jgi:predicted O-linked N-acetylglucosamine transferase (SPINDLY family)
LTRAERYHRSGDLLRAGYLYGEILEEEPENAPVWCRLGEVYHALGQPDDAADCYRRAITLAPENADAQNNLGAALLALGRPDEAATCFRQALRLRPDFVEAASNLGLILLNQGKVHEAELSFRQAVSLRPDLAAIHNNLGLALMHQGQAQEAALNFRHALHLRPDLADAQNNLGLALAVQGQPDEALACFERAIAIDPGDAGALTNLGNAYKDQGRLAEAVACYRRAVDRRPEDPRTHSNLLLALHYQAGADPREILAESDRYAERHAAPLGGSWPLHPVRPRAGRRLRVGYVSADFRDHPVAYFLEPILASHDHGRFEIFAYADVPGPDAVTGRCQAHVDFWRSLVGLSDPQAADQIRQDGIDVLIDLGGHTGGNRLLVFARKPAPVQASYLGYLGTTGLAAIDYYITDSHADPPGLTEAHFQEALVRIPECAMCYWPGEAPAVAPQLSSKHSGAITFASLNLLAKVSDDVLAIWLQVLAAVPGSRLLLRSGEGRTGEERIRAAVSDHGLSPERVVLRGRMASRFDYLKLYQEVDLALDPFPYNGITTTCDALWMGVPVLTLAGKMSVSRHGVRFLRNVGLEELITSTPEDYVERATEVARDRDRLASLRRGLRERMRKSPLMNAALLTRHLETAYLDLWDRWAAG